MVKEMVTVAPGSKEMGILGMTLTIVNPPVDIPIEVICSVAEDVL